MISTVALTTHPVMNDDVIEDNIWQNTIKFILSTQEYFKYLIKNFGIDTFK